MAICDLLARLEFMRQSTGSCSDEGTATDQMKTRGSLSGRQLHRMLQVGKCSSRVLLAQGPGNRAA